MLIDINDIFYNRSEIVNADGNTEDRSLIFTTALDFAHEWGKVTTADSIKGKSRRQVKKDCYNFIYYGVKKELEHEKPKGFIDGFFWTMLVSAIVKWIVARILDQIFKKTSDE